MGSVRFPRRRRRRSLFHSSAPVRLEHSQHTIHNHHDHDASPPPTTTSGLKLKPLSEMSTLAKGGKSSNPGESQEMEGLDESSLNDSVESDEYDELGSQESMEENENLDESTAAADSALSMEEDEEEIVFEGDGEDEYDEEGGEAGVSQGDEDPEGSLNHRGFVPGSADDIMNQMQDESSDSNSSLYEKESLFNLRSHKSALKGFTDEDQNRLFPMVDEQSQALFELVQELEDEQLKSSERALLEAKVPVAIPSHHLSFAEGGPEIKLRILDDAALALSELRGVEEDDSPSTEEKSGGANAIVTNVTDVPDRILAALPTDLFSREKKQLLMKTFELGWKREIVMRSNCHPGKKMGDVYYFSPEGIKFRSSKQVALYLAKKPHLGLTVDHFSFAKARVSFDPNQETIRQAYSGKGSILSPTKSQSSGESSPVKHPDVDANETGSVDNQPEEVEAPPVVVAAAVPVRASSSRRSIQPPKRYATGDTVLFNEKKPKLAASTKTVNASIEMKEGGMEMGMLPPKYPRDMEESKASASGSGSGGAAGPGNAGQSSIGGSGEYTAVRRGRPPKLGGKKLIPQKRAAERVLGGNDSHNSADDEDGPMFGISALTRTSYRSSFVDSTGGYQGFEGEPSQHVNDDGEVRDQNEEGLQPCSIRCPGMSGDIPTLQCRRCLCLYHPQCLGLPNQNYKNFFCANCEDDDGAGESQQQQHQEHRFVQSRNNVHHNLPQQHHRQQQMQGDQRIRLMRGGGAGGGYGKRPPPSLIRMQGRSPQLPQHHMGQQQQPQMMNQMRGIDPRKMMLMKGSGGPPRGSGLQLGRGGGASGIRHPMRLELPKLNLRPILKRAGLTGSSSEMGGGLTRGLSLGGFGRGRGRPPRSGGPPGSGINLPQFLKNNRINAGGAVTITPIGGLNSAAQSTYRKMGSGAVGGGSSGHLSVPKLPLMRPMKTSSTVGDATRLPNQRMMRGGLITRGGRGGHGVVMAAPYRLLKPKMPFTEPEGDESLQQIQISMSGPSSRIIPQQTKVNSGAAQRLGVTGLKGYPQGVVTIGDKKYIAVKQPYKASLLKKVEGEPINNNLSNSEGSQDIDESDMVLQETEEDEAMQNEDVKNSGINNTEVDQENLNTESEENDSTADKLDLNVQSNDEVEERNDGDALYDASQEEKGINSAIDQENLTKTADTDDREILDSKPVERNEIKAL